MAGHSPKERLCCLALRCVIYGSKCRAVSRYARSLRLTVLLEVTAVATPFAPDTPRNSKQQSDSARNGQSTFAPTISLPKGGGAIRGIGEKFGSNPVTGTGSMSVPIATSPGRSGFAPQLSLSYDSGAGNGLFGFGWNFSSLRSAARPTRGFRALTISRNRTSSFFREPRIWFRS